MKRLLFPLLSSILLSGCANVELSSVGAMDGGDRMLVIQNDGYMLLGLVPLVSGSLDWNDSKKAAHKGPAFFTNRANVIRLYEVAQRIADREKCDLVNPAVVDNSMGLDPHRVYGLITYDDVTLSAVLRPKK